MKHTTLSREQGQLINYFYFRYVYLHSSSKHSNHSFAPIKSFAQKCGALFDGVNEIMKNIKPSLQMVCLVINNLSAALIELREREGGHNGLAA